MAHSWLSHVGPWQCPGPWTLFLLLPLDLLGFSLVALDLLGFSSVFHLPQKIKGRGGGTWCLCLFHWKKWNQTSSSAWMISSNFVKQNPCRPTDRFGGKTLQLSKLAGEANKNTAMVAGEHQRWLKQLGWGIYGIGVIEPAILGVQNLKGSIMSQYTPSTG